MDDCFSCCQISATLWYQTRLQSVGAEIWGLPALLALYVLPLCMSTKESSPFQVFMKLNVKIFEGLRRVRAEEGEEG